MHLEGLGMGSNWEVKSLDEILEINPALKLPKGTEAKKVAMEYVAEFTKKIQGYENVPFTSGSKFQNDDTLMARITPCLENGKTAFVDILEQGEIGFGSTEYFVLRAREGVADAQFIYYLATSNEIRTIAIKSMTGTSGRQRAQKEALLEYKRPIPSLNEQRKIGKVLSLFDQKIEKNKEIIKGLELLSKALFKRWFIAFECPNEQGLPYRSSGGEMVESELGEIPKNFTISNFDSLISETIGGDWGKESVQGNYTCDVSILRGADIPEVKMGNSGKVPKRFILEKNYVKKKLLNNDIVIEISGGSPTQSTGRVTYINEEILGRYQDKLLCTNFCRIMRPKLPQAGLFIYMYFDYFYNEGLFFSYENGTTGIKNFDINSFIQVHPIAMPNIELIIKFNEVIEKYYKYIQELGNENLKLEEMRDSLLPKLLSGEIEIPDESVVESL